jgi:fused signal recognition particle receptor
MLFSRKGKDAEAAGNAAPGGLFGRLKSALSRTRGALADGIAGIVGANRRIDDALVEDIETVLLSADVGVEATTRLVDGLHGRIAKGELGNAEAVFAALREDMVGILEPVSEPLSIGHDHEGPFVILVIGVNGSGKTTTIGKLARRFLGEGRSVMLAAGDTFRAAAVEQLQTWGERNGVAVVAQHTGADSASVIYDAVEASIARGIDVLIADTAGRLHTHTGLMEELKKVARVTAKLMPSAPHETLLVMDAGTGQNALAQASQFHQALGVTGLVVTKLDGTARGGVVFAMAERIGLPIRFIGVGEGLDDLRVFDAAAFVDALIER